MTRQIVWKEVREQGSVLLALVGLGVGLMAATAILRGPGAAAQGLTYRTLDDTGRVLLVMLVLTAGTVAGGSLFAGEREQGTLAYLDHLPSSRWRVWWRKVLAGGLLAGLASLLLLAAAGLAGQLGGTSRVVLVGWTVAVLFLAGTGFGWGVFGSAKAESSLAACGIGLAFAGLTALLAVPAGALFWNLLGDVVGPPLGLGRGDEGGNLVLFVLWAILCVPLPLAAVVYTAPDRDRRLSEQNARPIEPTPTRDGDRERGRVFAPRPRPARLVGARRLNWLTWRQLRVPLAVQAAAAVGFGLLVVPWTEAWQSTLFWPAGGLLFGVLAGVATLADEQRTGAGRFWAERRLPVGRLWRAKVLAGAGVLLAALVVALVPPVVGSFTHGRSIDSTLGRVFVSGLFVPEFPRLTYLLLGPAYGFAFGHLAGLLFPKGVVAGAVGLLVGGTVGAAWGPSLLAGGLSGWVVFVPPLVALLTARSLMWAWATGQLARPAALGRLVGGFGLALGCVAAGLTYRALGEVAPVADPTEHIRFRDALPTFDEKQAGRDVRRALGKWTDLPQSLREEWTDNPLTGRPDRGLGDVPSARTYTAQMGDVLRDGWPAAGTRPDLDRWMDRVFESGWDEPLFEAAGKPVGVLEDPNEMAFFDPPLRYINNLAVRGMAFLARGLQEQARGRPEEFVRRLDAWLATCRTAGHHTLPMVELMAGNCERPAFLALDRWLKRLAGRPDLLKQALGVVRRHDNLSVYDPASARLAEQVIVQNAVDAPTQWLPRLLEGETRPPGGVPAGGRVGMRSETEANVIAFAWAVPWEKERLRRAVSLGNDPARRRERADLLRGAPGLWVADIFYGQDGRLAEARKRTEAARKAAVLVLAARLHAAETGRLPQAAVDLVPTYLTQLPADPFDGRPMRYRRLDKPAAVMVPEWQAPPAVLPPGAALLYDDFLSVAGLAGGLTGWAFEPGWIGPDGDDPPAEDGPPGFISGGPAGGPGTLLPLADRWRTLVDGGGLRELKLAAGRAVVWSVGPDLSDGGGWVAAENNGSAGDLLFLVPAPPASPRVPAPGR